MNLCIQTISSNQKLINKRKIIKPQIVLPERGEIISAGNFHGEYPARAMDYLAIGVHELASMSERRVERLVNPGMYINDQIDIEQF